VASLGNLRNPSPEVERRIHKALIAAREKEGTSSVLRLSSAGECVRSLWAGLRGLAPPEEIEPRILAVFELGKAIEDMVVKLLRDADYLVLRQQEEIAAFGGRVVGHIDGTTLLGRSKHELTEYLLEIKSSNARRFEELLACGYEAWSPKYAAQLHAYMGFLGLERALVIVACKDDSRIHAERIRFDRDAFIAINQRLKAALDSERAPARPAAATSQFCGFCKYCPKNEWCWGPTADVSFDV
jgi:hypothetical protein